MPIERQPFHVVVAEPFDDAALARLREVGSVNVLQDSCPDVLLTAVEGADALLVRTKAHVTAKVINAAQRLKVIGRASPSLDHIDLRAAHRRGIPVVYAPHVAVSSTAEFAFALILALHRRVLYFDHELREGKFETLRTPHAHEMSRQTLGLLGVDGSAEMLARLCGAAFNLPILYHDPGGRTPADFQGKAVGLKELLATADILSIHLPLCTDTRHMLNADRLGLMKPTAIVVNTSRGAVIDTGALAQALKKHRIAGAALDVFEVEPLPTDHPLRTAPNCILTPHVGGMTLDAAAERFHVAEDVIRVLLGETPRYPAPVPCG